MKVRVRIEKGGRMPESKTAVSAGFDCYARSVELDGDWLVYHRGNLRLSEPMARG